ncbi:exopolysaccharide production repressor protein [Mesorhizobium sp. J8]|uniref:exopolysaccharide production repressor protein n=1 Tax=Mesorhizobium sp. J8 TaxID=2777475 RepID=UPI001CD8DCC8|nr:exopolysaccharide production repressor protein [Mesorhizobium sp. J8]
MIVYFASHSIRTVVVTTLACSLLLQVGYFATVLFLIWRYRCADRACQRAEHFAGSKEVGHKLPDYDEVGNESSDEPPLFPMGGMWLLH